RILLAGILRKVMPISRQRLHAFKHRLGNSIGGRDGAKPAAAAFESFGGGCVVDFEHEARWSVFVSRFWLSDVSLRAVHDGDNVNYFFVLIDSVNDAMRFINQVA